MNLNSFEVRNLDLYYGDNHALKDINIDIKKNKVTAFIGPSGCGKGAGRYERSRLEAARTERELGRTLLGNSEWQLAPDVHVRGW